MGRRQQLRRVRHVSDGEVRDLQSSGFARLTSLARVPGADDDEDVTPLARTAQRTVEFLRSGPSRETVFVWIILLILLVGGSRHLITRTIPAVGEFATMSGPATLLEQWTSARSAGLGAEAAAPTAFGVFGALGGLFLRQTGLLRMVLILGTVPLGFLGAWRLTAPTGSRRARLVSLLTYAFVPVAYNALEGASGGGGLRRRPMGVERARPGHQPPALRHAAPVGVRAGVGRGGRPGPGQRPRACDGDRRPRHDGCADGRLPAHRPSGLGHPGAGRGRRSAVTALVLQLPWSTELLQGDWYALGGMRGTGTVDFLELLRFDTGPVGASPLGYLIPIVALLPF